MSKMNMKKEVGVLCAREGEGETHKSTCQHKVTYVKGGGPLLRDWLVVYH
jgi:hypothetical protein